MDGRVGWALVVAVILSGAPARGDVYAWVDEEGTVHYEDGPPAARKRARKVRLPAEPEPPAQPPSADVAPPPAAGARPPSREATPERRARAPRRAPAVELYTTSWCPWCKKAREWFASRGIAVTEHDIEKEADARRRKIGFDGGTSVPTAVIGGRVVRGYSPSAYQAALDAP